MVDRISFFCLQKAITKNMGSKSKTFALFLMVTVALSCLTLLATKPANVHGNAIPSVSILYPTDSTVFNVSIEGVFFQLLYQTNDTISWAGFSINGGTNVTCTGNITEDSMFIKDGYQFDFGHPTLTLYANDTAGNWAVPQTVTYTVYFYADSYSASSSVPTSPSSSPTSTLAAPEFPVSLVLPLLLSVFSAAAIVNHRKQVKKI